MVTHIGMTIEELEESLTEILSSGFEIKKVKGKIVIYTNLSENEYGELIDLEDVEDDDDEDGEFDDDMDSLSEIEDMDE
jgi:hypothetical protein